MKHSKILTISIIIFAFVVSFIIPSFKYRDESEILKKKQINAIEKIISSYDYIDKDNVVKLDDNYYSIDNDNMHLIDLNNNKVINSSEIISNNDAFKELLFRELRLKYPLFIVEGIINNEFKEFNVFNDRIYVSYENSESKIFDAVLICKDYKDFVNYKCVDNIEEDPNIVQIDSTQKIVALTFDDGPCIYTDGVMEQLNNFNMKATFFELGSLMERYPDVVKRVKDNGYEIGSHGYSHKAFTKLKVDGTLQELARTNEIYKCITGEDIKLVRPPYGSINATIRDGIATTFIKWSVDSLDWKVKDERYVDNIMNVVKDGDIILVHDIQKTTLENLSTLLTRLYNDGFQVVTVSELAAVKGINMETNKVYFHFRSS